MSMWTPLDRLKALIWVHAAVGVALVAGVCWATCVREGELLALGFLACGILWMLGIIPLRGKAEALQPEELQSPPPALPGRLLGVLAAGQFLSVASFPFSPLAWLILPANGLLWITILFFMMNCNLLDLPIHRSSWGRVLGILFLGSVWNGFGGFVLASL